MCTPPQGPVMTPIGVGFREPDSTGRPALPTRGSRPPVFFTARPTKVGPVSLAGPAPGQEFLDVGVAEAQRAPQRRDRRGEVGAPTEPVDMARRDLE